jgi:superfamily II DNA or RNA helicase
MNSNLPRSNAPPRTDFLSFSLMVYDAVWESWQLNAVDAWIRNHKHGIFDVFTGAGKSWGALRAMMLATQDDPSLRLAIVAPTKALVNQWLGFLSRRTNLQTWQIGVQGMGRKADFRTSKVIVFVLASARKQKGGRSLLARKCAGHRVMLVVDECHKAGARKSKAVFDAPTVCRLGLSATARRNDADATDARGETLPLDNQAHGKALGGVCYQLTLADGRRLGMLPRFEVHHHSISLNEEEWAGYEKRCRDITDLRKAILALGGNPDRYRAYLSHKAKNVSRQLRDAAVLLQNAYFARKRFLYRAAERARVAQWLLQDAWGSDEPPCGALLFNELIRSLEHIEEDDDTGGAIHGAEALCEAIQIAADAGLLPFSSEKVAVEHSGLPDHERQRALEGLREGLLEVLVTVRALREGIDVPEVGMGICVASSASIIGIIQMMGRLLRAPRDAQGRRIDPALAPVKRIHILHAGRTVDERMYRDADWNDLLGAEHNHWWHWELGADGPIPTEPLLPEQDEREATDERVEPELCVESETQEGVGARFRDDPSGPLAVQQVRMSANSSRQRAHQPSRTGGRQEAGAPWFDLLKEGVLAYLDGDAPMAQSILLRMDRARGRARHAHRALSALLRGERLGAHSLCVSRSAYPELLVLMSCAHNSGRSDLVTDVALELHRRAHRRPNPRRWGLAAAAVTLAHGGETHLARCA